MTWQRTGAGVPAMVRLMLLGMGKGNQTEAEETIRRHGCTRAGWRRDTWTFCERSWDGLLRSMTSVVR